MNTTKYLSFFIFLLFVSSCGSKGEEQNSSSRSNIDEFRSYPIDLAAPKVKFSELIESVRIVRLEETAGSLLGAVQNVKVYDDLIAVPSISEDLICFFNENGDFLSTLNRKGDGPEEYSTYWDFWLNGETVNVFDNVQSEVYSYTLKGDFLSVTTIPFRAVHLMKDGSEYWLDASNIVSGDSMNYSVIQVDEGFNNPTFYMPFKDRMGFPITTNINTFSWVGDHLVYKKVLGDTLYSVTSDSIRPYIHFDLGDDYFWADEEMRNDGQKAMSLLRPSGKVWFLHSLIGERYMYLTANSSSFERRPNFLIDRESGDMVNIDLGIGTEEVLGIHFNSWESENEMLVSINSLDLAGLLNDLSESQYSFAGGSSLESIESSENPAMMWVKFKNEFE